MLDAIALFLLHEPLLPVAARPVVTAVFLEEALSAPRLVLDIAVGALISAASSKIHAPAREADAFRIAIGIHLLTEKPLGSLLPVGREIVADILSRPAVAGPEILYGLEGLRGVDGQRGRGQGLSGRQRDVVEAISGLAPAAARIAPVAAEYDVNGSQRLSSIVCQIDADTLPCPVAD